MQKTLLTLALVAGLGGSASAQRSIRARSATSSGVSLGLKAGVSQSDIVGQEVIDYQSIYGFHAGVFANISLSKLVAFQPEVLYSQKGAKAPSPYGGYITRRFHYIDVPLAFHVNTNGFFLEGGPQISVLLKAQDQYGDASATLERDQFRTATIGYLFGLGYQRKSGLGFGLRYNGEFLDVAQPTTVSNVTTEHRGRNSAFQLYLSYSIREK